jgi:hypothetical protein
MTMPIEIELLVAAWDNAKKNVFCVEDDMDIDAESGEIVDIGEMDDERADLVAALDDKISDLISYYRADHNIFYGEDDESKFVGVRYDDESEDDIRETAENL